MAHLVVVVCDQCHRDGERVDATEELVVAFNNGKPRRMDLCAEHRKPWDALRELAESTGVVLRTGAVEPVLGSAPCPECGRRFQDGRGLASHVRLGHEQQEDLPCPECGRTMRGTTGLNNHRRSAHGVKSPTMLRGELTNGPTD